MLEYIIGTMLLAGIVGGLINFFLSDPNVEKPLVWWQHIVVGIGASFMVPVFLNTISSRLIADISGTEMSSDILSKLLILAGFCLLAAVSSRAFIRSMTDHLLREISAAKKEAKEAKQQAQNAEDIAELTVEPETLPEPATKGLIDSNAEAPSVDVTDTEKRILKTMVESRFSMRSISGIAKHSGLSSPTVNSNLGNMMSKALVDEGKNKEGQLRWYATALGRQVANGA